MAGGLCAVTLSEAADYSVSDEDLRSFGLDEESRITVEAVYTDSRIVYLISDEICQNILNS